MKNQNTNVYDATVQRTEVQRTEEGIFYNTSNEIPEHSKEQILSWQPKAEWIETLKEANNYKYLPIDKIEWLLSRLFKKVDIEITHIISDGKRCIVGVNLIYEHNGWMQKKAGVGCVDESSFNSSATAFPIAKSIAIRDAAELIGNIFGGNLNRKSPPVPVKAKAEIDIKVIEFSKGLANCHTFEKLEAHYRSYHLFKNEPYFKQIKALYLRTKNDLA